VTLEVTLSGYSASNFSRGALIAFAGAVAQTLSVRSSDVTISAVTRRRALLAASVLVRFSVSTYASAAETQALLGSGGSFAANLATKFSSAGLDVPVPGPVTVPPPVPPPATVASPGPSLNVPLIAGVAAGGGGLILIGIIAALVVGARRPSKPPPPPPPPGAGRAQWAAPAGANAQYGAQDIAPGTFVLPPPSSPSTGPATASYAPPPPPAYPPPGFFAQPAAPQLAAYPPTGYFAPPQAPAVDQQLSAWFAAADVPEAEPAAREAGVRSVSDLAFLDEETVNSLPLQIITRKKLLMALAEAHERHQL
jgi:hypothetical protein